MKVKELVELLEKHSGRIPILVVGNGGTKRWLSWHYMCDDGWDNFQFILQEGEWYPLDNDGALMLMEHAMNDPDVKHELSSDFVPFTDYEVEVTWLIEDPGCWGCTKIQTGKYETRELVPVTIETAPGIKDISGGMIVLFCTSSIPEYSEKAETKERGEMQE